jgi:phospholipase/carboxylesterase
VELKLYTIDGRGEPSRLLFLLHGYSANEFHLAAYGPLIDPEARFLVAAPRGPLLVPADGAAWWDVDLETFEQDHALVPSVLRALDRTIDGVCRERGFSRDAAVIGGFSQGAALALALAFRRGAPRHAGVVCLSGFLLDDRLVEWDLAANRDVPVFVGHGTDDPIIGSDRFDATVDALGSAGGAVHSRAYPMAHDIHLDELIDLRDWLADR